MGKQGQLFAECRRAAQRDANEAAAGRLADFTGLEGRITSIDAP